jgi:hypothetical protein
MVEADQLSSSVKEQTKQVEEVSDDGKSHSSWDKDDHE